MTENPDYREYRFPPGIIARAVWLNLVLRSTFAVENLLAERGVTVSYETIRQWCLTFESDYAPRIKKHEGPRGDRWFLDEVVVSIRGNRRYLWQAVDQDGDRIEILVQKRKDTNAAKRFFKGAAFSITSAARDNNRAGVSHEPTREQERQMRGFRSDEHAQRFMSVHGQCNNHFRIGRHLLKATHYRELRLRAFQTWSRLTCA